MEVMKASILHYNCSASLRKKISHKRHRHRHGHNRKYQKKKGKELRPET